MPAFTLYGARGSTNTDRVRLTLAEGGFEDYDLVLLNLQKGDQKVSVAFLIFTCRTPKFSPTCIVLCSTNTVVTSPNNI